MSKITDAAAIAMAAARLVSGQPDPAEEQARLIAIQQRNQAVEMERQAQLDEQRRREENSENK